MGFPSFSAGDVLAASDMNAVQGWKVAGGTYTAADPLDITGCFSSDYTHYRIVGSLYGSQNVQVLRMNFFTGTNTLFNSAVYNRYGFGWISGAISGVDVASGTTAEITVTGNTSTQLSGFTVDVFNPNSAVRTKMIVHTLTYNASVYYLTFDIADNSQFTGFRLDAASGSLTGSVRVYGLRD